MAGKTSCEARDTTREILVMLGAKPSPGRPTAKVSGACVRSGLTRSRPRRWRLEKAGKGKPRGVGGCRDQCPRPDENIPESSAKRPGADQKTGTSTSSVATLPGGNVRKTAAGSIHTTACGDGSANARGSRSDGGGGGAAAAATADDAGDGGSAAAAATADDARTAATPAATTTAAANARATANDAAYRPTTSHLQERKGSSPRLQRAPQGPATRMTRACTTEV